MVSYIDMPVTFRVLFEIISYWIMLSNIGRIFASIHKTGYQFKESIVRWISSIVVLFVSLFIFLGTVSTERIAARGVVDNKVELFFASLPWLLLVVIETLVFAYSIVVRYELYKWEKTHVSLKSIKESYDRLPMGVCYFDANGLPILFNYAMTKAYFSLNGPTSKNLFEFVDNIKAGKVDGFGEALLNQDNHIVFRVNDTFYSLSQKKFYSGKDYFYELIISDVTKEYQKTAELISKKEELESQSNSLAELGKTITQVTIDREMLIAKIRIHDKLGETLLVSKRYLEFDEGNMELIQKMWADNLYYIQNSTEIKTEKPLPKILNAAKDIDAKVVFVGDYSEEDLLSDECDLTDEVLSLIASALHESVTNTIRHTDSDTVYVDIGYIDNDKKHLGIELSNDGSIESASVAENGGLRNLRSVAERVGFEMQIKSDSSYKIVLTQC